MTDERALTRAGAAAEFDSAAFESFYAATAPALAAYVRHVSGDPASADDVVQEAFLRFLRGGRAGMDEARMRGYVYRAATTILYDQWRRRRTAARGATGIMPPAGARPDPAAHLDVARALAGLTPRERALVWLAYVEGASHAEIAGTLGLSRLSVRVLLFRARGKLARALGGEGKL
jgi:RNA polymerase sigma-70 factor (ECF subfamily)